MKLYELLEVMAPAKTVGYITVMTEAGSAICYQCGPAFVRHTFKDRDVVSVQPVINTAGELGQVARAGIVITVNE